MATDEETKQAQDDHARATQAEEVADREEGAIKSKPANFTM
jgi:hypothetical protein